jgi:hypothetical protein
VITRTSHAAHWAQPIAVVGIHRADVYYFEELMERPYL